MKETLLALAMGATVTAIAPILLPLPKPMATGSLLLSMGLGGTLAALAKSYERIEKIETAQYDTAVLQPLRVQMAQQRTQQTLAANAAAKMDALVWADQCLPQELQAIALAEFGLQPLHVQRQQQVVNTVAREMPREAYAAPQQTVQAIAPVATMPHPVQSGYGDLRARLAPQQQRSVLEAEDIAQTFAQMTLDSGTIKNVIIPAEAGATKSTIICALIHATNALHSGQVDFKVFAGKKPEPDKDPGYCGIEHSADDYMYSGSFKESHKVLKRLKSINELLSQDALPWPTILIQDELNNTLGAFKMASGLPEVKKIHGDMHKMAIALNNERLTQGRSRRIIDIATAHSMQVQNIGYDTDLQENFHVIIPGRYPIAMNFIEESIRSNTLISNPTVRQEIREQFAQFLEKPSEGVIVLTNLGGKWRLRQTPDYRPYARPIERGILNTSCEELADEFAEDIWEDDRPVPTEKSVDGQQRLMEELLDNIAEMGAWSLPQQQGISAIALKVREFWAEHGKVLTQETAIEMAGYLWEHFRPDA